MSKIQVIALFFGGMWALTTFFLAIRIEEVKSLKIKLGRYINGK